MKIGFMAMQTSVIDHVQAETVPVHTCVRASRRADRAWRCLLYGLRPRLHRGRSFPVVCNDHPKPIINGHQHRLNARYKRAGTIARVANADECGPRF